MSLAPVRIAVLAALALAALGAVGFGWGAAGVIETRLEARVRAALDAAGAGWAEARADGWTVRLSGAAPDAAAAETARRAARRAAKGATLRDAVGVAKGAAEPLPAFALDILIGDDGATLLGDAPNAEAKAALIDAVTERAGLPVLDLADAADRDAPAGWTAAAEAAAESAAALAHGRIAVTAGGLAVAGLPENAAARAALAETAEAFAAQGGAATLDLIAPQAAPAPPPAAETAPAPPVPEPGPRPARARGAVWLRAAVRPDLATLTGAAPDAATRKAVLSYAAAAFGAERVHDGLAVAEAGAPPGWRAAALAGLDALSRLERGRLEVADGRVVVVGASAEPGAARAVDGALDAAGAVAWKTRAEVTVDLPARAARLRIPAAECARRMTEIAVADPIRFAPGEAAIEDGSGAVLDALAALLPRCAERTEIEIGGHTDSQGSEGYNMRLSARRAEAVRDALIDRGAPPAKLTAKGYGEAAPIADNDTEDGRARNRRIAFTNPGASPAAGGPEPEETAE